MATYDIKETLTNFLEFSTQKVIYGIQNKYSEESCNHDQEIWENEPDFYNEYYPTPWDALEAGKFGDVNLDHDYVKFDSVGYPKTTNDLVNDNWIDIDSIVDYAMENDCDFDNTDIREILDGTYF
jgi:hypothetical protein